MSGDDQTGLRGETTMTEYGAIKLTNYRVVLEYGSSTLHRYTSVTLDAVTSCEITTGSRPLLLILAILCVPGAALSFLKQLDLWLCAALLGTAILLIVVYAVTRNRGTLTITSHGQPSIEMLIEDVRSAVTFLDRVQEMKLVALGRVRDAGSKSESA